MNKPKFPEKPTQLQEIRANVCDALRVPRLEGAMTHKDWELDVMIYWCDRALALLQQEKKND
tara:strand:+ start:103 stop:288 length:186 start_codon:yes stop_codon:yes gene_type:complete